MTPQLASAVQCSVCGKPIGSGANTDMSGRALDSAAATPPAEPILFPVSLKKFIVMDLVTLGLYNIFWAYKNWEYYKNQGRSLRPGWRAWFSVFYLHGLLKDILQTGDSYGLSDSFSPILVFVPWLLLQISSRLPDPLWLISFLSFVPLISVLRYINEINRVAGKSAAINSRFSRSNWIGIAIGFVILVLAILGSVA